MKYTYTGKNYSLTSNFSSKIENKLDLLEKYFIIEDGTETHVSISFEKEIYKVEITIFSKAGILRAEDNDGSLNMALDSAIEKLEKQIIKNKDRLNRKKKSSLAETFIEETSDEAFDEIVKVKQLKPKAMDAETAALEMELLGHDFYVYLDEDTNKFAVIYSREFGGYGLLEIE
ncbi:MAG: ribosome hibernation-promoting factor, HPF/YfiA family [Erysipelotrichaceae bacterium]